MALSDFQTAFTQQAKAVAEQQARLSQATASSSSDGTVKMYVPAKQDINDFATSMDLANRTMGVQGELLQSLGTKIQDWGKNTQWAGRQMMVGFTVPFAAMAAAAGAYALQIDQDMTRIEKVYDGSTQGLKQNAMDTANAISQSMGQSADSTLKVMYDLASAGKTGTQLMQMTTQAQTLSTLGNIDQEESVKSLIAVQNIFGLNTKQLGDAVNYLNSVEAQTPSSLTDLVNAIPIAGTVVKSFGGTLQDTTILLSAFREKGISTQEGANAIKTSMARLIEPTASAQKIFKEFTGKDLPALVDQAGGKPLQVFQSLSDAIMKTGISLQQQQQIISTVFGKQQYARIDALLGAMQETQGAVAKAEEISNAGPEAWAQTTQQHLQAIQSSTSNQFKVAVQSFKTQFQEFGTTALQVVTVVINAATKLVEFFDKLPAPIKDAAIAIGAIVALAGPITMIVGLFGNFVGTITKVVGALMRLGSGYKTVTLEQRAAQLSQGDVTNNMLSQNEMSQVLVYQLGKLTQAYQENGMAAKEAAAEETAAAQAQQAAAERAAAVAAITRNKYAGIKTTNNGPVIEGPEGTLYTVGPGAGPEGGRRQLTDDEASDVRDQADAKVQYQLGQLDLKDMSDAEEKTSQASEKVVTNTSKASVLQKAFSQQTLLAAGAVTGIASAIDNNNNGMSKFLTYTSDALFAFGAMYPLVSKIGTAIKASNVTQGLSSVFTPITNAASKLSTTVGNAMKTGLAAIGSPVGLAIAGTVGVALAASYTILKTMSDNEKEQVKNMEDIANSTDSWMNALGQTKLTWGQIRTETGQVNNSISAMIQQMRQKNSAVVNEFAGQSGSQLQGSVEEQAYKLIGQGLNENDVINALNVALQAAGKSAGQIQTILSNLSLKIDFSGGEKQLDNFVGMLKTKIQGAMQSASSGSSAPNWWQGMMGNVDDFGLKDIAGANLDQISKDIVDSMAGLDDSQKKYISDKLSSDLNSALNDSFKELQGKYGNQLQGTFQQNISKYLQFTPGKGYSVKQGSTNGQWEPGSPYDPGNQQSGGVQANQAAAQGVQQLAQAQYDLSQKVAKSVGITGTQLNQVKSLADVMRLATSQNISASDAQNQYNTAISKARDSGIALTQAQRDQIAAIYAAASGTNAADLENNKYSSTLNKTTDELAKNQQAAQTFAQALSDLADTYGQAASAGNDFWTSTADAQNGFQSLGGSADSQAQSLTNAVKSSYSGAMNQIYDAFQQQAQDQWQQTLTNIQNSFEAKKNAIQKQMDALDQADQAQSQAFSDKWNDIMDQTQAKYQANQDAINSYYQTQSDAIDNQIKQIQNQQKAEQTLDDQRQKEFEAEQTRMQRLSQLQNNQIDYSKDVASGKLDDAAKVQNDNIALQAGWSAEDSQTAMDAGSTARTDAENSQIDALNAQKDSLDQAKQNALDALKAQEDALEKSLQKQQEMQQRAMEQTQQLNKQTLQNKIDELSSEETAAQNAEQKKQEMQKMTLDIELNNLKTFIPQNEQQLNDHIKRTEDVYGQFGVQLQTSGSYWGQIIGNALQTNVDNARQQISQDASWSAFGSQVSNAITQGAFGMNLNDFFNMLVTGQAPKGSPLNPSSSAPVHNPPSGAGHAFHTGGLVGTDAGGRLGITGPLTSGEIPAVLQKGEYVLNQQAVQKYGSDYLQQMNLGNVDPNSKNNQTGMNAVFAGGLANMMRSLIAGTIIQLGTKAQSSSAGGNYTQPQLSISAATNEGIVQQVFEQMFGWGHGAEWNAAVQLIMMESGFRNTAQNPTSTAYGIFQFLDSIWKSYGVSKTSDPTQQSIGGARYIKARYGDPINALVHEHAYHWYDKGGIMSPGVGHYVNASGAEEAVLTNSQWRSIDVMTNMLKPLTTGTVSFEDIAKDLKSVAVNVSPIAAQLAANPVGTGDSYNIQVQLANDPGMSEAALKRMMSDAIHDEKMKTLRKTGKIR